MGASVGFNESDNDGHESLQSTIFAENCEHFWSNKLHDVKFHTLDDGQGCFKKAKSLNEPVAFVEV